LRVLAKIDGKEAPVLASNVERDWQIRHLDGALATVCSSDAYDALIMHPLDELLGGGQLENAPRVCRSLRASGAPPLVLFFAVETSALKAVVQLARFLRFEVATVWPDGHVDGLRGAVQAAASSRLAMRIVDDVIRTRSTAILDPRLVTVMTDLFRKPRNYASADRAIALHNLTVTRINGMLARVGLRSFEHQRRAARTALAYELIGRCGLSVQLAARRLGCGSVDTLSRDVRKVVRATPTEFAKSVNEAAAAQMVMAYLTSAGE
jgi:hypothetical protein